MGYTEIFVQYRKLARAAQVTPKDQENYHKLMHGSGFSHNLLSGQEPKSGYMVGLNGEHGGVSHVFPLTELTPERLAAHRAEIAARGVDPDAYQGGWVEGDKVYLDLSKNVQDREKAVAMGKQHNQKAIYHIDKGEDVPTGGTGE